MLLQGSEEDAVAIGLQPEYLPAAGLIEDYARAERNVGVIGAGDGQRSGKWKRVAPGMARVRNRGACEGNAGIGPGGWGRTEEEPGIADESGPVKEKACN